MAQQRKIVTLKYERVSHRTAKATLFKFAGGEKVWFPDSVTDIDWGDKTVQVPEDLAIEQEVDDYAVPV